MNKFLITRKNKDNIRYDFLVPLPERGMLRRQENIKNEEKGKKDLLNERQYTQEMNLKNIFGRVFH